VAWVFISKDREVAASYAARTARFATAAQSPSNRIPFGS